MGGKKRSRDDGYENIMKKIRKLERKVKKRARYRRESSSSECDELPTNVYNDIPSDDDVEEVQLERAPPIDAPPYDDAPPIDVPPPPLPAPPTPITLAASSVTEQPGAQADKAETGEVAAAADNTDLTEEILDILGEDPSTEKPFGEDLHKDIAPRWKHILSNGLNKENRTELLKQYLPSENCINMKAPKLNAEVKAALNEINNKKDVYSQSKQNQITSCLSAIGKAMNVVLTKNISHEVLKPLSDAGRLLCDYHYKESLSRRYATMNTLTKNTKDAIKNTKIDEYLFGSDLAEQLKSSKAISKSGSEMRPPAAGPSGFKNKPTVTASTQPQVARRANTLNVRGASRASAAEPRANPVLRRQQAPQRQAYNYRATTTQRYRSRRH